MSNQQWISRFEEFAREEIQENQIPAVSVGLAKEGQRIYTKGFGFRDQEQTLDVNEDTIFGIGSITKSFTCVAIMQLQEAGKLAVHDPVVKYLPEFRIKDSRGTEQMTIHHMMTHSTGLPPLSTLYSAMKQSLEQDPDMQDNPQFKSMGDKLQQINTYEELMAFVAEQEFELLGPPGTEFSYSNDSYALLGAIIERVSGKSYETYVKEHLLQPAGMTRSFFLPEELDDYDNIALLYSSKEEAEKQQVYPSPTWWDSPSMRAAGFLKSTASDMLKYTEIFRTGGLVGNERILTAESVKQMLTPYIGCELDRYYGYGLMLTPDYYGAMLVEHGGSIKGVQAQMNIIPQAGLTGIVLTNLSGSPATALMNGLFNCANDRQANSSSLTYQEHQLSEEQLAEYTGVYQSGEGAKIEVKIENGACLFVSENKSTAMLPIGEDRFLSEVKGMQLTLRFIRNETGRIVRLCFGFRQLTK